MFLHTSELSVSRSVKMFMRSVIRSVSVLCWVVFPPLSRPERGSVPGAGPKIAAVSEVCFSRAAERMPIGSGPDDVITPRDDVTGKFIGGVIGSGLSVEPV